MPAEDDDRDLELMSRLAQSQDEKALAELFDRHGSSVYGLARSIVSDAQLAEEVLQDTFLRVARQAKGYRTGRMGALPWLLRVARNASIDVLRRRKHERKKVAEEALSFLPDERSVEALEGVSLEEFGAAVREALAALPDGPRKAIDLAYFAGLTHTEIAATLEVPLGTIKTRIRAGLSTLASALSGLEPELR